MPQGGLCNPPRTNPAHTFFHSTERGESPKKIHARPRLLRVFSPVTDTRGARPAFFANRVFGDFIKQNHALHVLALEFALGFSRSSYRCHEMASPRGSRGRSRDATCLLEGARNGVDVFLVAFDYLYFMQVLLRVDSRLLSGTSPQRGHRRARTSKSLRCIILDGLRLGRRLHITRVACSKVV